MLTPEQPQVLSDQDRQYVLTLWELSRRSPWYFLKYFARTFDEHDPAALAKPFPATAYARIICRAWEEFDLLFIKKSRQIRMTWEFAALFVWDAINRYNRHNIDQSKKQPDANKVINRQRFIYDRLEAMELPGLPPAKKTGVRTGTDVELEWPTMNSHIEAIPQGGDIVRSLVGSNILADEINHQNEAQEGFEAAAATIIGGGKWIGVGTSNGHSFAWHIMNNFDPSTGKKQGDNRIDSRKIEPVLFPPYRGDYADLVSRETWRRGVEAWIVNMEDDEFMSIPFPELVANVPGIDYWQTHDEKHCMWVHYSADPDKSQDTAAGRIWKPKARRLFPSDSAWNREMEGNDDTFEGRPVVSNWSDELHLRPYDYDPNYRVDISHDFGTEVCGTLYSQLVPVGNSGEKQLRFLDETILRRSNTIELAEQTYQHIKERYRKAFESRWVDSCCDPNGNQESPTTSDKSMSSNIKIMKTVSNGLIRCNSKKFGDKESTQVMEAAFALMLSNGEPAVVVHPRCTYLRSVLSGGLHYELGDQSGHYEKDGEYDHGGDMARYRINNDFDDKLLAKRKTQKTHKKIAVRCRHSGRVLRWETVLTEYGVNQRRQGLLNVRR